jgi:hypothetical protein
MNLRMNVISTALGLGLSLIASGCCEEGSGVIVQESRRVPAFRRLTLDLPGTVLLSQGPTSPLKIRTDDNLIDDVLTRLRGDDDTLIIEAEDCCVHPTELTVQVSTEELDSLVIDGSGDVVLRGPFEAGDLSLSIEGSGSIVAEELVADDMVLAIDGSGDMDLELDAGSLRSSIGGSGGYRLSGTAAEHAIRIEGSGDIDAAALQTAATSVDIDGSGDCIVSADERLDVSIEGSGEVAYCGRPQVSEAIDGSGEVSRAADDRCD